MQEENEGIDEGVETERRAALTILKRREGMDFLLCSSEPVRVSSSVLKVGEKNQIYSLPFAKFPF